MIIHFQDIIYSKSIEQNGCILHSAECDDPRRLCSTISTTTTAATKIPTNHICCASIYIIELKIVLNKEG